MDIAAEKDRLKKEIDKITDPNVLMQIRNILSHTESLLNEEQLRVVNERRTEYLENPSSAMDSDEFDKELKKRYGF
ncbi:MAG: hypothetical protein ACLGH8_01570 [Bacteroidia bacterium]